MPTSPPPLRLVVLHRDALPENAGSAYRSASADPEHFTLARALARRAPLGGPPGLLVARPEPTPVLAAIGRFGIEDDARLHALGYQLRTQLPLLSYLDHRRAEAACERLADGLRDRFDAAEIARMRFVGVPRGGLIVLGMLAYALDLSRAQLGFTTDPAATPVDGPLVVVDDCVISGLRLGQFMAGRPEPELVVATLFSHPDLRAAVQEREPRVRAFVSAYDVRDHAQAIRGADYEAWRARWQARADPGVFWVGEPDHVCFPWGEPESSLWNPSTEREELGWSLMPPESCLKHRHAPRASTLTAQLQPAGNGLVRAASHVVYGDLGDEIVIGDLETLDTYALDGIAAAIWRAILSCEDVDAAAAQVASEYDVEHDMMREQTTTFIDELATAGLVGPGAA